MNADAVRMVLSDVGDEDLINIFVFNESIRFTKEEYYIDIHEDINTLAISTKKGRINGHYIDIDSIKHISIVGIRNFGADPRDI